jgi:spore germination protein YaaH
MLPYQNTSIYITRRVFGYLTLLWLVFWTINTGFFAAQLLRLKTLAPPTLSNHIVIGFLPYWSISKAKLADYQENVTTLTYFGLSVNPDGTIQKQVNRYAGEPGWNTLHSSKMATLLHDAMEKNFELSLLVHNMNDTQIRTLIANPEVHALTLINEVAPLMEMFGFTDLNLDFESFSTGSLNDQQLFIAFVTAIKRELTTRNLGTLTIEITPVSLAREQLIDPASMGLIADYIVLMAYDYNYAGSLVAGAVAPLGGKGVMGGLNVSVSIKQAQAVISPEKLVLGIPLYGYDWKTWNASIQTQVIRGSGQAAPHKRIENLISECAGSCLTGRELGSHAPYVVYKQPGRRYYHTIFYEDSELIEQKLNLIPSWGGAAVWALGYEGKNLLQPLIAFRNQQIAPQTQELAYMY